MLVNIGYTTGEAVTKVYLLEEYRDQKDQLEEWKDDEMTTDHSKEEVKAKIKELRSNIRMLAKVLTYLGVGNEKDY